MDNTIIKIAALPIKNRKLLLVRSQDAFFTVGGKLESGESETDCLIREVKEELGCNLASAEYFRSFEGKAHNKDCNVKLICYYVQLLGEPSPSSEIKEMHWWDSSSTIPLSDMLIKHVLPSLKKQLD